MPHDRVVVIGAGVAGLTAALLLAARGVHVTVLERQSKPGGKLREIDIGGRPIDAGPTVFTMRWVFDEIFAEAGGSLDSHLDLMRARVLARHAWNESDRLDLLDGIEETVDAVSAFSSPAEGRRYRDFCTTAEKIFETLDASFIRGHRTNVAGLVQRVGLKHLPRLLAIKPFAKLWNELGRQFRDPRLQQLFARYATYSGSSPFAAPATLMLIAHVEREGVWLVKGGMHRIAVALADAATSKGALLRYGTTIKSILVRGGRARGVVLTSGEVIEASAIVSNADAAALADGCFGDAARRGARSISPRDRSLSAMTWAMVSPTGGFPLSRHNVFFSGDYRSEFVDLFRYQKFPLEPTVYICAQDRDTETEPSPPDGERLFLIGNAPAVGDSHTFDTGEIEQCRNRMFQTLARCGLEIRSSHETTVATTPSDFEDLFPATGGALYGRATHGSQGSFKREGARSRIPGLYLAGGSVHPGAGVPMAAISGRLAAASLLEDLASRGPSRQPATPGGTSMR